MIHQYSLPESVGLVKDILKKLHRFIDEVPSKRQHGVFTPLLPAIVLLCQTFPPLSVEAIDFLLHLCRVCLINNPPGSNGNSNMGCPLLPLDTKTVLTLHASSSESQELSDKFSLPRKDKESELQSPEKSNTDDEKMAFSSSPLFVLDERLLSLKKLSLLEGAKWAFDEISKTVLMKVSCKT